MSMARLRPRAACTGLLFASGSVLNCALLVEDVHLDVSPCVTIPVQPPSRRFFPIPLLLEDVCRPIRSNPSLRTS